MKLLTHIQNCLFPVIKKQSQQIAGLQQELLETLQRYKEHLEKEKEVIQDIEYLYQIFIHRNHYRFQLHLIPKEAPLLLTIGRKQNQIVFVLHIPSLRREVATVIARPVTTTLVIDTLEIDALILYNRTLSVLFAQEMIAEAKAMGMEQIADVYGQTVPVGLSSTERLYVMMGMVTPPEQVTLAVSATPL